MIGYKFLVLLSSFRSWNFRYVGTMGWKKIRLVPGERERERVFVGVGWKAQSDAVVCWMAALRENFLAKTLKHTGAYPCCRGLS